MTDTRRLDALAKQFAGRAPVTKAHYDSARAALRAEDEVRRLRDEAREAADAEREPEQMTESDRADAEEDLERQRAEERMTVGVDFGSDKPSAVVMRGDKVLHQDNPNDLSSWPHGQAPPDDLDPSRSMTEAVEERVTTGQRVTAESGERFSTAAAEQLAEAVRRDRDHEELVESAHIIGTDIPPGPLVSEREMEAELANDGDLRDRVERTVESYSTGTVNPPEQARVVVDERGNTKLYDRTGQLVYDDSLDDPFAPYLMSGIDVPPQPRPWDKSRGLEFDEDGDVEVPLPQQEMVEAVAFLKHDENGKITHQWYPGYEDDGEIVVEPQWVPLHVLAGDDPDDIVREHYFRKTVQEMESLAERHDSAVERFRDATDVAVEAHQDWVEAQNISKEKEPEYTTIQRVGLGFIGGSAAVAATSIVYAILEGLFG